jgi:hypothetical protein
MLFSQIQIHNFLTFKGTNTLEFPDPELTDHALLLVLAANTAGKTSIIRALRFLFCDDPLNHPNELDKLINDGAAAEASANDTVNGWVQVKVYSSKGLRTIRRRIETRCTAPGFLKVKNKVLEEERHGRSGDSFVTDEGEIQRALSLMVPPELFDYFFFEGEELAARLVGGKSSHGIRDGLATLIQDHPWGEAVDSVRKAVASLGEGAREAEAGPRRRDHPLPAQPDRGPLRQLPGAERAQAQQCEPQRPDLPHDCHRLHPPQLTQVLLECHRKVFGKQDEGDGRRYDTQWGILIG